MASPTCPAAGTRPSPREFNLMPIRVGFLSVAHMHAWGYASGLHRAPEAELVGVWDDDSDRAESFARTHRIQAFADRTGLLNAVDAVVITSENKKHAELIEVAAKAGKHILCEKPLVTSEAEGERALKAAEQAGIKLMTAFPCRFSPAFQKLVQRVKDGDVGKVRAICATNRGSCPFGWFVDAKESGGGSMIDHVVHVADLLRVLLGQEVVRVQAQVGHNMYGRSWEDTAMLTLEFPEGVFATLDSSWSRPKSYKTWGDVTMRVVGEGGLLELDMFAQQFDVYTEGKSTHTVAGYGSDLDRELVAAFLKCVVEDTPPPVSARDGLQAARVALAGYESVRQGMPVNL
jgi:predicted dehydrogenase